MNKYLVFIEFEMIVEAETMEEANEKAMDMVLVLPDEMQTDPKNTLVTEPHRVTFIGVTDKDTKNTERMVSDDEL